MFEIELIIYIKMDLALNNLQRLICHKTQQTNQLIYNLRWTRPLNRFEDCRLTKQTLFSKLRQRSRISGRSKVGYMNIIKGNLEIMNIPLDNWQYLFRNKIKKMEKSEGYHHRIQWTAISTSVIAVSLRYQK